MYESGNLAHAWRIEDRRRISVVCARLGAKHGEVEQRAVLVVQRRSQAMVGVFIAREQIVHIQLGPKRDNRLEAMFPPQLENMIVPCRHNLYYKIFVTIVVSL